MPQPQHNIDVGTLGPNPCQIALNRLLIELDDPHVTKKVTSKYHDLRNGLIRLECIEPYGFCITIMQMYYQRHIDVFESHKGKMKQSTLILVAVTRCFLSKQLREFLLRILHSPHFSYNG
jgi:hypothetical protein